MADLPVKPVEKVIEIVLEASIRQLDYIINYKDHEEELKELIKTLESNKKTVDEQVQVAKDNAEEITRAAQDWLKRVERKMEEKWRYIFRKSRRMADLPFKPLEKVIDKVLEASIRQLDYIINYKDHEEELKELIKTLESNKETVDGKVKAAKDNVNEMTSTAIVASRSNDLHYTY
ncbi:hypothetical protein Ahy_A02g006155 [Arachis hypogaea]|uniref:Uncharacterized protein n=1 Tax=Arachis hypogaea TaxID=3818 RepID=A0A445E9K0_ARAHY|nr:hypothetical protein Ahy_A02g006155 [Arachis hypogaea]